MVPPLAKRLLTLIAFLGVLSCAHTFAQQNIESMVLNVAVTDEKGNLYGNLQPENFSAWVDKVPRKILSVSTISTPVSVGIVIDFSGSMGPPAKKESKEFWRKMGDGVAAFLSANNPENDYFASMFDGKIALTQRWTGPDISLLENLTPPGDYRGTALYDALYFGVQTVMSGRHSRRVIVLISDGDDNASKRTFNEVAELLRRSDVTLFSIGLIDEATAQSSIAIEGARVLEDLAAMTGGRQWFFSRSLNAEVLKEVFHQLAAELQNQYQLSIEKQDVRGREKFRKVTVKLNMPKEKGRPKLYVRCRHGYYQ